MQKSTPFGAEIRASFSNQLNNYMQNLKLKYRLYPTAAQENILWQICGAQRYVWNHFLAEEQKQYSIDKKFRFFYQNSKDLTALKKTEERSWLNDVPSTSLQQTLRNFDSALRQSFKRGNAQKGFPKFKRRKNFLASFTLAMVNAAKNIRPEKFYIPKIGDMKCIYHRGLTSDFKTAQIKHEAGRWHVVLTCTKAKAPKITPQNHVGIDLNSKEYVLSDGTRFEIPKFLKENQLQIKKYQRSLSRKKKGSRNRLKAQGKLAKLHQRIARKRLDYFHKLSHAIVRSYDRISLEDLSVSQIQRKMGRVTADNGFAMFRQMIVYKAELYGKHTSIIDRYFPSSQLCSQCGSRQKIPLHIREYDCHGCGVVIDRDLNAAINIDRAGTARSAFGDDQFVEQVELLAILADINEEGSHVL